MASTKRAHSTLETVAAARWRIAVALTLAMMAVYFGFILLVAFNKELLATLVTSGLSLGILLGALVIVTAWVLTWIYVRWANRHYDQSLDQLRQQAEVPGQGSFGGKSPASRSPRQARRGGQGELRRQK